MVVASYSRMPQVDGNEVSPIDLLEQLAQSGAEPSAVQLIPKKLPGTK
jgi:hypothetical protein